MTGKAELIKKLQRLGLSGKFDDLVKGDAWNIKATFVNSKGKRAYFYYWVTLRHSDMSTDMNQGIKVQLGNDDEIRVIRKQLNLITVDDILRIVYEIAQGLTVAVWANSLQHLAPYGNQAFLIKTMIGGHFIHDDQAWTIADRRLGSDNKVYLWAYVQGGSMLHEFTHKDGVTAYVGGTNRKK